MVMDKNGRSHKPQGLPQRVAGTYDVMTGVGVDSDLETASHTVDQPVFAVKGHIVDANGRMRVCKLDCRVIYPGQSYGEHVYTEADSLLHGARGPLIEISDPTTGNTRHYYLSALRAYTEQYVSALDLGDNYMIPPRELSQLSRNVADYEMEYWNTTGQTVPHPRADQLSRQHAMAQLALSDLPYAVESFKEPSDTKPGRVQSGIKITNTEDGSVMRIGVNDLGYVTDITMSRDDTTGFDSYKPARNTIYYTTMVNRLRTLTAMREEHGAERVREYIIANEQGAEAQLFANTKQAEAVKVAAEADAKSIELKGVAEGAALAAKGKGEAEGIEAQGRAYNAMNNTFILSQQYIAMLPEIARAVAEPLTKVDSITMYGDGNATKLVGDTTSAISQMDHAFRDTLGIDLSALLQGAIAGHAAGRALADTASQNTSSQENSPNSDE